MNPSPNAYAPRTSRRPKRKRKWLRRFTAAALLSVLLTAGFLYLTPAGSQLRTFLAETVLTTQHRGWAWIFVGKAKAAEMLQTMQQDSDMKAKDRQNLQLIQLRTHPTGELVKVEDISGKLWQGKMMTVSDPRAIRVVVPEKQGEGERITDMVKRTGAIAGVNGGGFDDPQGLGNGFAAIGLVMSDARVLYADVDSKVPEHIVGFSDKGALIIGKYSLDELRAMHIKEAVSFYPRTIVNGKPLITSGDGGWGRAPRTAIGQKADGSVVIVVIDGRQTRSIGATLREVQDLMLEQGVVNGGFLDGGASSEMVANDQLLTHPSSRYGERRLPSAFLVFAHPEKVTVSSPWAGLSNIDPGGASTHPDYQNELQQKRAKANANVHSGTSGDPASSQRGSRG